jgi:hypothetical protein
MREFYKTTDLAADFRRTVKWFKYLITLEQNRGAKKS